MFTFFYPLARKNNLQLHGNTKQIIYITNLSFMIQVGWFFLSYIHKNIDLRARNYSLTVEGKIR